MRYANEFSFFFLPFLIRCSRSLEPTKRSLTMGSSIQITYDEWFTLVARDLIIIMCILLKPYRLKIIEANIVVIRYVTFIVTLKLSVILSHNAVNSVLWYRDLKSNWYYSNTAFPSLCCSLSPIKTGFPKILLILHLKTSWLAWYFPLERSILPKLRNR